MNPTDLDEFTELLTTLCALYKTPISETLIELYWDALVRFEWRTVKAALQAHLANPDTGQLMPKPADVIRYVRGSSQTQALQAWSKVAHAMRTVGGYSSVVFDDALVHAVIADMGGWISVCQTALKDLPFRAKEFEQRYVGYVLHPLAQYPQHLIGLEEQHNRFNGYPIQPPLLIGSPERALVVFQQGSAQSLNVQPLPPSLYPLLESMMKPASSGEEVAEGCRLTLERQNTPSAQDSMNEHCQRNNV